MPQNKPRGAPSNPITSVPDATDNDVPMDGTTPPRLAPMNDSG